MYYVYLVKNKTTGLKYIGAKYAKNSDPRLFWIQYFTSSKKVKALIDMFGKDDFKYKILKTFTTRFECLSYENNLNRIAFYRDDYLNIHYNFIGESTTEDSFNLSILKQKKAASITAKFQYLNKSGFFGFDEEKRKEISKKAGLIAGQINKQLGRAIFDPEVRKRQHQTLKRNQKGAFYDPILKKEICKKGGQKGMFSKSWYEKNGKSENDRIEAQRRRGKKGGKGNKGFKWYNDGIHMYKYTKKQDEECPFEQFILLNPQYKSGTLLKCKNRIWINDGEKNYFLYEKDIDLQKHTKGRLGDRSKFNGHKNKKSNKN